MTQNVQLIQSIKKWNLEKDLNIWEKRYFQNDYDGNRLRSRESKALEYLESLNLKLGARILELGYGAGLTSAKMYEKGYRVVGIDISKKLTDMAIKNCLKVTPKSKKASYKFMIDNAEDLKFKDESFDVVIGIGFLQYLEKPKKCLSESKRVLKKGGHFIIAQRNMFGISSIDGPLKLLRASCYLITNKRYELRWQDTPLVYLMIGIYTILSIFSRKAKDRQRSIKEYLLLGRVKKNALSYSRMTKIITSSGMKIIKSGGAGYLSKKSKIFPKIARKIDKYLQKLSKSKENKNFATIHKFGNSTVFLARK